MRDVIFTKAYLQKPQEPLTLLEETIYVTQFWKILLLGTCEISRKILLKL